MSSINENLEERSSFFYCALSFLLMRNSDSLMPELIYFMHPDQVLTLLHTFGGRTLRVPTVKEFSIDMDCSMAVYLRICHDLPWPAIQEKLRIDGTRLNMIKARVEEWTQKMEAEGLELPPFLRDRNV